MERKEFLWSDNWWIEDDKAYFCAGKISALFCMDMKNHQCELLDWIPECNWGEYRVYSYCIKYGDVIFCLPHRGNAVWGYDMITKSWKKTELIHKNNLITCMNFDMHNSKKVWMVEINQGKIYEFDLEKKAVGNSYAVERHESECIGQYVFIENTLYCTSGRRISRINIFNSDSYAYEVPGVKADLYNICYDGHNFWLSGYYKEIYVWNSEQGTIKVIDKFPERFGVYLFEKDKFPLTDCGSLNSGIVPFFIDAISLGKYVWFIPFQSNEILYIDKETYEIHILEAEDEQETEGSLDDHVMMHKYLVEYIRGNRYIGLYSLKNHNIFEIDAVELSVKNVDYSFSERTLQILAGEFYKEKKILYESSQRDKNIFSILLRSNCRTMGELMENVGSKIHHALKYNI